MLLKRFKLKDKRYGKDIQKYYKAPPLRKDGKNGDSHHGNGRIDSGGGYHKREQHQQPDVSSHDVSQPVAAKRMKLLKELSCKNRVGENEIVFLTLDFMPSDAVRRLLTN